MVEIYGMIPCFARGEVGKGLLQDVCKVLVTFQDGASGQVGMDFFCDGAMFIGGPIYIMQQGGLGEWSGFKTVLPCRVLSDEHSSCCRVEEGGGSSRGEGGEGG